jgi:hypothetical protein
MRTICLLILVVITNGSQAQETPACPCCTENHREFDFWLGEWSVYGTNEALLGGNTIVSMQDGCVLQENWEGASGSNGTSYNFFDASDSTWNQVWVDNTGNVLRLKGNPNPEGAMVMTSELLQNAEGQGYYHQISWTPHDDGSVIQLWVTLDAKKKVTSTLFQGVYKKK